MARAATSGTFRRGSGSAVPAYAYLAVPAVVLALGFFLLVRSLGVAPGNAAPVVVVIANALLALPFAIATLGPPLDAIARSRGTADPLARPLAAARQFALVEWPLIGREVGVALALSFCFSLGDLGVIALFGTQDFATLPLLMLRALGAYRTDDAAAIAALMLLCAPSSPSSPCPACSRGSPMLVLDEIAFAHPGGARLPLLAWLRRRARSRRFRGASGSGKSTLLDLIAGFLVAGVGHMMLDGARPSAAAAGAPPGFDPVPVRDAVRAPERRKKRRARTAAAVHRTCDGKVDVSAARGRTARASDASARQRSPAARSSASRWPAPCSATGRCCCSTNRSRRSTTRRARRRGSLSGR